MSNFFKALVLSACLITGLISCTVQPGSKNIKQVEGLILKGELTAAAILADNLIKSHRLSERDQSSVDSLLEIGRRIRKDFTLSETTVINGLRKYNPEAGQTELLRLEKENKIDLLVIDGQKVYFKNSVRNVLRLDSVYAKLQIKGEGLSIDSLSIFRLAHANEVLKKSKNTGRPVSPVRMKLSYTIRVAPDAVPAGETIRCWMPYPREGHDRQQEVRLKASNPITHQIAPATDLQRSIFMEKVAVANQPTVFQTEIEYTSFAQCFRLSPEMIKPYRKSDPVYQEFTVERPPHIVFNDRIKILANSILRDEINPLLQVRKIYKWINDSVTWTSALEYSIMPDIPGFVMKTRHGDCGMQTLLFMTLARSVGIPVKWQSGWMLHPGEVNLHDWCEVYYEGIGWVPLDQSFGIQNSADENIRDFYITGIDAYRLIVNDDLSQPLSPAKKFLRSEPYDFQRGELEWKGGNLYFDQWSWHMDVNYN